MPDVTSTTSICKVDDELGLVFGWAMVSKDRQADGSFAKHYDTQEHHIPEDVMLKSLVDFAKAPEAHDMHRGAESHHGDVLFMFPMTEDIAKSLSIETPQTGTLIAMRPSKDILAKYKSGEYTGFSIGGSGQLLAVT